MTTRRTATPKSRAEFGSIRELASGRFQARYVAPDPRTGQPTRFQAPHTFEYEQEAKDWLRARHVEITEGKWRHPDIGAEKFGDYAKTWMFERDLKPSTREHYQNLLDGHILPSFKDLRLDAITTPLVKSWYARTLRGKPTMRAHSYSLFKSILATAVGEELLTRNPCNIPGAGSAKRASESKIAEPDELAVIAEAMPARLRMAVELTARCALRFGEMAELRRKDVLLDHEQGFGVLDISRGVTRIRGEKIVGSPKSAAGKGKVFVPPQLLDALQAHLDEHVGAGPDALLFPGAHGNGHLASRTLYDSFYPAREAAGRPDLRWHDLRHTAATNFGRIPGATLADIMRFGRWSSAQVAMRYQHSDEDRQRELVAKMLKPAPDANVVPIKRARRGKSAAS
jgi:integrase